MAEPSLRIFLSDELEQHRCDICGSKQRAVSLERLCEAIAEPIRTAYEHGRYNVFGEECEGDDLTYVLTEELGLDNEGDAEDIAKYLCCNDGAYIPDGEEPFFSFDATYVRRSPENFLELYNWRDFSRRIKHESRYFGALNSSMEELFRLPRTFPGSPSIIQPDLFGGFELQNEDEDLPIRIISPSNDGVVFRARVTWEEKEALKFKANPHTELSYNPAGPPAGRMNAEGVPVFYCSLSEQTAIKEMRAGVGSIVVVGRFRTQRDLRLLDITKLGARSSNTIFSPVYAERNAKIQFLSEFDRIVSRPVRTDHERLEYLPTQVVAEYVHHILKLDGVVYSSAQESGETADEHKNIAIFGCASWVAAKVDADNNIIQAPGSEIYSAEPIFGEDNQVCETLLTIESADVTTHRILGIEYNSINTYLRDFEDSEYEE